MDLPSPVDPNFSVRQRSSDTSLRFQLLVACWLDLTPPLQALHSASRCLESSTLATVKKDLALLLPIPRPPGLPFWQAAPRGLEQLYGFCSPSLGEDHPAAAKMPRWQRQIAKAMASLTEAFQLLQRTTTLDATQQKRLQRFLDQGVVGVHRFSLSLINAVPFFHDDENVIFFLLRYASQLDSYFETGFTSRLLKKMSGKEVPEIVELLIQRYDARGFGALQPLVVASCASLSLSSSRG